MILFFGMMELLALYGGLRFLKRFDEKAGIEATRKEYLILWVSLSLMERSIFSIYGYGREFFCHSFLIFYLIIAAFIDYKIQKVYRIGSLLFIVTTVLVFFLLQKQEMFLLLEKLTVILVFSMIIIFQGLHSMMGWGDVLTYIGIFFWIASLPYTCMTVEILAVYMLIANLLFFIGNIKKFNWETKALIEESAFLPAMAGALEILFLGVYVG